jgi:hypothetical protein
MRLPRLRRPRLSYANVTATLALLIATSTGGAYAAATIGSGQIKDDAVKSRHIADATVKASDLRDGAVTRAKLRDGAVSPVKLGPDVAAARAYGTIWHSGTIVTGARNLSPANVTRPEAGVYCIQDLPFTPSIAIVSSSFQPNAFHHNIEVYGLMNNWGNDPPCPATSQIQIRVYMPGTTTKANGNFNIVIF